MPPTNDEDLEYEARELDDEEGRKKGDERNCLTISPSISIYSSSGSRLRFTKAKALVIPYQDQNSDIANLTQAYLDSLPIELGEEEKMKIINANNDSD